MVFRAEKSPGASGTLPQAAMPARPAPPPMPSFKKPRPVRTASLWRNPRFRIRMPRRDLSTPPARGINRRFRCMNSGLYRGSLVYGRAETGCFPGFFNELGNAGHFVTAKGACQKPLRDRKCPVLFNLTFFGGIRPAGPTRQKEPRRNELPSKVGHNLRGSVQKAGVLARTERRRATPIRQVVTYPASSTSIQQVRHLSSKFVWAVQVPVRSPGEHQDVIDRRHGHDQQRRDRARAPEGGGAQCARRQQ